jgi:uncharacterized membrane protein YfcA
VDPLQLAYAGVAIAIAALLRGLTGFGFSIAATPLLSLAIAPEAAVPVVLLLQAASGLEPAVRDRSDIDVRAVAVLCLAALPGIVPGLLLLDVLSSDHARRVIAVAVIASALALATGFELGRPAKTRELAAAGAIGGVFQGLAAMAGPPMIALLLASSWPPARCRATLSFTFLVLALVVIAAAAVQGLLGLAEVWAATVLVLPLLVGQRIGATLFHRLDPRRYRVIGIGVILATGVLALGRSFL